MCHTYADQGGVRFCQVIVCLMYRLFEGKESNDLLKMNERMNE